MHADASYRVHNLEIIRIVGDQAVPDVLRRRMIALIRQDRPAASAGGDRLIIGGKREQVCQIGFAARIAFPAAFNCLLRENFLAARQSQQRQSVNRLHKVSSSGSTSSE